MRRRILTVLAAVALCVCMLPSTAYADRWTNLKWDNIQMATVKPPLKVRVRQTFTAGDIFPGRGKLSGDDIIWDSAGGILAAGSYPFYAVASGRVTVYLKDDMNVSRDVIVSGELMLSQEEIWVGLQQTAQLKATYNGVPVEGKRIEWQIQNASVASVTGEEDSTVRGKAKGETYLTARYNGETAVCEVIVDSGSPWEKPRHTGLVKKGEEWVYLQNGRYNKTYTGLGMCDNQWFYVNQGALDASYTGFTDFEGSSYLVCNGRACTELNSLQQNPADGGFYFLAGGRWQKHTGWAEYDSHWFILADGQPDTGKTGLVEYNGGVFAAAGGQVLTDYSGLFLNAGTGIVNPDNRWYFLSNGQVQKQYSGLALYDRHWFYIQNGVLEDRFTGIIAHNGGEFYVINGELADDYTGIVFYNGKRYLVVQGQVRYDYGTGRRVWIDATAKKYHDQSDCSGMDAAFQVSIEMAEELGRTACKKCVR